MKRYKIIISLLAFTAGLTSCNDFLDQQPPSELTSEGFFTTEDQVQAAANQLYTDILPGHGEWNYGTYTIDNNTDNQVTRTPDSKFSAKLWRTGNTNDAWNWDRVRDVNYQLYHINANYRAGKISGSEDNLKQYIGELYFLRAYAYFKLLRNFGDLPVLTEPLPDNEAVLVAASVRQPRNEVARFIINNLDTAATMMKGHSVPNTRIGYDAVQLFKSRVALFEGTWLTNFAGTPFVPNGPGWPGAQKTKGYQFPTGSVEAEAKWFFEQCTTAAEEVADKYKDKLSVNTGTFPQAISDPVNPYLEIWGTTDCSNKPEVLLWRQYSKSLGVQNNVEVSAQRGNIGTGFTRSLMEGYLMKDGKPIYASAYEYCDTSVRLVRKDRDPRLAALLKAPGDINNFKNNDFSAGDHWMPVEPIPAITNASMEKGHVTGYAIRKGMTHDRLLAANGGGYNACVVFRATEALLNFIEADYMLKGQLSAKATDYWKSVRRAAGFKGDALLPQTTIDATDISRETRDWGAYTAGKLIQDKTLYNIRRERRSELIAEGLRDFDLSRWRSYEQLITVPAHAEGIHFWNTPMQDWYRGYVADGSNNATISKKEKSEYFRPQEVIEVNNSYYNGLTWRMAHYLQPLPLRQFLLTAPDHATMADSPLYQNPYWPMTPNQPAEK